MYVDYDCKITGKNKTLETCRVFSRIISFIFQQLRFVTENQFFSSTAQLWLTLYLFFCLWDSCHLIGLCEIHSLFCPLRQINSTFDELMVELFINFSHCKTAATLDNFILVLPLTRKPLGFMQSCFLCWFPCGYLNNTWCPYGHHMASMWKPCGVL